MPGVYAKDTKVPARQSRDEIERTLERYGADAFAYGMDGDRAVVQFRAAGRHVRLDPSLSGLSEQQVRQRWRALALVVKSKLEAVATGLGQSPGRAGARMRSCGWGAER